MPATPAIALGVNEDHQTVAAISGSDVGAVNTLQVMRIDNQWPQSTWQEAGSRSGDGEVTAELAAGVYWGAVKSTVGSDSSWSIPKYLQVAPTDAPVMDQILEATVARIRLLNLEEITAANVHDRMTLDSNAANTLSKTGASHVLVAQNGEEYVTGGTTTSDWYWYYVQVALVAPGNRDQVTNRARWNRWREQLRTAFVNQPLVIGEGRIHTCEFVKLPPLVREYWEKNLFASLIGFRFRSAEFRGMGI